MGILAGGGGNSRRKLNAEPQNLNGECGPPVVRLDHLEGNARVHLREALHRQLALHAATSYS